MSRAIKRGVGTRSRPASWAPLSHEARALIASPERDGLQWGYVSLACGAAAQRCAFGVGHRPPDLLTDLEPVPVLAEVTEGQGDLFPLNYHCSK